MQTVSEIDVRYLQLIRKSVSSFIKELALTHDKDSHIVLDIAPQDHAGVKEHFVKADVKTLDVNPANGADYVCDITKDNRSIIRSSSFDLVVCTEVLEHTRQPFGAARELHRLVKDGGAVAVTTPLNFRIHGPLPDCWRFTEHGLRELFSLFSTVNIESLESDRFLFPVQYRLYAIK